jgi:hypothetical protein
LQSFIIGGKYMEPQPLHIHAAALPTLHGGVWKPFMDENQWNKEFNKNENSDVVLIK